MKEKLLPKSNSPGSPKGKSGVFASGVPGWNSPLYPTLLIFIMSLYFSVFVLELLDVNVDDGSGLISAYEQIRLKNEELEKQAAARLKAVNMPKINDLANSYQGDNIPPWENPFVRAQTGRSKPKKPEAEDAELFEQLQDSIFNYITENSESIQDATADEIDRLVHEDNQVREKLRKRQIFVETSFDKVTEIEASLIPRDYIYISEIDDPRLTMPPTVPLESAGSVFSSFLSSITSPFGRSSAGSAPSETATVPSQSTSSSGEKHDATTTTAGPPVGGNVLKLRQKGTFASLAGKDGRTNSVLEVEKAMVGLGYHQHKQAGLPLWLLSYARKCPSQKAIASKDGGVEKTHVLWCTHFTATPTRSVVGIPEQLESAGVLRKSFDDADSMITSHFTALLEVLGNTLPIQKFYRFYNEKDRTKLQALENAGPFVVIQNNGGAKPQLTKSVKSLIGNSKYTADGLAIVASPMPRDTYLWGGKHAVMIRSWVVAIGSESLVSYSIDGDVVRSKVEYVPFTLDSKFKESSDQTVKMRFPSFALAESSTMNEDVELVSMFEFAKHLKQSGAISSEKQFRTMILNRIRQMSSYVSASLLKRKNKAKAQQTKTVHVEHICLDFLVSDKLDLTLLATASDCPIGATTKATKAALTDGVINVAENLALGQKLSKKTTEGLNLLIHEGSNFLYHT